MSESQPVPSPLVSMPTSPNGSSGFYIHATSPVTDLGGDGENDHPAPLETRRAGYFRIKGAVDRLITAILTVIALPVMLLVAAAILLLDRAPGVLSPNPDGQTWSRILDLEIPHDAAGR